MIGVLSEVDDWALWLAAVVAGLGAVGWLLNRIRRAYKALKPWVCRLQAVLDIAEYELQHNGGGSIKDAVSEIPRIRKDVAQLKADVAELKQGDKVLREGAVLIADRAAEMRTALDDHVQQADSIHDEQAAAIANLAEALPIVARSTPHPDDTVD